MPDPQDLASTLARIADLHERLRQLEVPGSLAERFGTSEERAAIDEELRDSLAWLGVLIVDALADGDTEGLEEMLVRAWPADAADAGGAGRSKMRPPWAEDRRGARYGRSPLPDAGAEITPDLLARLQRTLERHAPAPAPAPIRSERVLNDDDAALVRASLDRLGPCPVEFVSRRQQEAELQRIEDTLEQFQIRWGALPRRVNHGLASLTAARTRHVQESLGPRREDEDLHRVIDNIFPRLSAHAKETQPGTVHGLARDHSARSATWRDDALGYEERLRAAIGAPAEPATPPGPEDVLRGLVRDVRRGLTLAEFGRRVEAALGSGCAPDDPALLAVAHEYELEHLDRDTLIPVRKALRAWREALEAADDGEDEEALPERWRWAHHLEGKRLAIIGGEAREERLEDLRNTFRLAHAEWIENLGSDPRKMDALLTRLQAGTLDGVILLRPWTSHTLTDRLFPMRRDDALILLADGYRNHQVRAAIERLWAPSETAGGA